MTGKRRSELVAARADLILSSGARAYAAHFEAQLRRGVIRRLLYATYVRVVRSGASLAGVDPAGIR